MCISRLVFTICFYLFSTILFSATATAIYLDQLANPNSQEAKLDRGANPSAVVFTSDNESDPWNLSVDDENSSCPQNTDTTSTHRLSSANLIRVDYSRTGDVGSWPQCRPGKRPLGSKNEAFIGHGMIHALLTKTRKNLSVLKTPLGFSLKCISCTAVSVIPVGKVHQWGFVTPVNNMHSERKVS